MKWWRKPRALAFSGNLRARFLWLVQKFPLALRCGFRFPVETSVSGEGNRHQQTEGTMELIGGLWSALPSDLLERVLSFLPVPDLCRYCSVCKQWNALICTPEFGAFCMQHAGHRPNNGACLVFKVPTGRLSGIPSWSIFDLTARRWYDVKITLPEGHDHDALSMDGGLICTFVNAFTDGQRQTSTIRKSRANEQRQTLIVSNLVGKIIMVLPNPPLRNVFLTYVHLQLAVDSISRTYRIYIIQEADYCSNVREPVMCVYESSTNQWRISSSPPSSPCPTYGLYVSVYDCSAMYQGLLYVLYASFCGGVQQLCRYNFVEDAWEDTGMKLFEDDIFISDRIFCDLVVSDNRLFLLSVRRISYRNYGPMLDISEILLAEKSCKAVVQITNGQQSDFRLDGRSMFHNIIDVRAYGFDKSILLVIENVHGRTGQCTGMLFNLVTGLLEVVPLNLVERYTGSLLRHANQMSYLCLPATLWN